jgi:predicted AlkP superfamily pyrophosphatase or phosphodiesterase
MVSSGSAIGSRAAGYGVALALGAIACGQPAARTAPPASPAAAARTAAASVPAAQTPERPRLVVAVVIDQLPSWVLERYLPTLSAEGALRRGMDQGVYFARSRYPYAGTMTAPGHATLVTGALPSKHGVVANEVWDRQRNKVISVVDDGQNAVIGSDGAFASPSVLRSSTVADALERATAGAARTVSLSYKDRSTVLSGGQTPDLALWYDSKRGEFTSSAHYSAQLPDWFQKYRGQHPVKESFAPWKPEDPQRLEALLGPDSKPGEGDWLGLGAVFPHDPARATEPASAFRATPSASAYLIDLARECVRALDLGKDDVPDLLHLSISGTDYVGHIFGPESWEYVDNLQRVDRLLGAFLDELARATPVRVLITSDHGAPPLVESSQAGGRRARRLAPADLAKSLNAALGKRFKLSKPAVDSFTIPFVYLSAEARASAQKPQIVSALVAELRKTEGIRAVRPLAGPEPATKLDEELERQIQNSISADTTGDIYVVPAEYSIFDACLPCGAGTNHGSPWSYDQYVPVLFWGTGISRHNQQSVGDQTQVAATLAALLGIAPPSDANAQTLPGTP